MLGRLPDVEQLAGAAAGGVILSVVLQMFFFLRMGTTALVAQRWGAAIAAARRWSCSSRWPSPPCSASALIVLRRPISVIGFALVGATPEVTALGDAYFTIRIFEAPFYLMTLALTAFMRGQGDALVPMYIVIGVNIVNIAGDLLLVPGTWGLPSFGVVGAAWAVGHRQGSGWVAAMVIGWRRVRDILGLELAAPLAGAALGSGFSPCSPICSCAR